MLRPVRSSLLLAAVAAALLSVGCRNTDSPSEHEPLLGPPIHDHGYDHGHDYGPDHYAPPASDPGHGHQEFDGPLLPVPDSGPPRAPAVRERGPIPIPVPASANRRSRQAPPMPVTARRGTVLFPSEVDRGLMPAAAREETSRRPWPFGRSTNRAEAPAESWPPEETEIERRLRSLPAPPRDVTSVGYSARNPVENPVEIEGLEIHESLADFPEYVVTDEGLTPEWRAESVTETEPFVERWPFPNDTPEQLAGLRASQPELTVPVSAEMEVVRQTGVEDSSGDSSTEIERPRFDPDAPLPEITPGTPRARGRSSRVRPIRETTTTTAVEQPIEARPSHDQPPLLSVPGTNPFE